MKTIFMLIAALALSCIPATAAQPWSDPVTVTADQITVVDAEHISVGLDRMRLSGVCVPAGKQAQAKQALQDMIRTAGAVRLQSKPGYRDRPARLLVNDPKRYAHDLDVGQVLIARGLARRC